MRERLLAAAPALAALCCGRQAAPAERLRRNVALYAAGLPSPDALLAAWRHGQLGPRLGCVQLVDKESLSEDQKLTVELAKLIKEDFLQQNGFSDHDRFCPNIKTYWMLKNFVNFYDQGMKAITNSDSERRITFALIRTTLEKEYVALTQMKFIVPPKNPNNYGRDIIAPMTALNEQIARGYQELEA